MNQVLVIPDFPHPTVARVLSPNGRLNRLSKEYRKARLVVIDNVTVYALKQDLKHMHGRWRMTPYFVFPDHRKRDDDNLATGVMKLARDTLVSGGWLEADDAAHLLQERPNISVEKGVRHLRLVFEELPVGIDNSGTT